MCSRAPTPMSGDRYSFPFCWLVHEPKPYMRTVSACCWRLESKWYGISHSHGGAYTAVQGALELEDFDSNLPDVDEPGAFIDASTVPYSCHFS